MVTVIREADILTYLWKRFERVLLKKADSEQGTIVQIYAMVKVWSTFASNITFNLFFKETQTVMIDGSDNSMETVKVEYLISNDTLTENELDDLIFTAYTAPFAIEPDNEYIVYVRLTDMSGNVSYIYFSVIITVCASQ